MLVLCEVTTLSNIIYIQQSELNDYSNFGLVFYLFFQGAWISLLLTFFTTLYTWFLILLLSYRITNHNFQGGNI